jgi:hypothetical protein
MPVTCVGVVAYWSAPSLQMVLTTIFIGEGLDAKADESWQEAVFPLKQGERRHDCP